MDPLSPIRDPQRDEQKSFAELRERFRQQNRVALLARERMVPAMVPVKPILPIYAGCSLCHRMMITRQPLGCLSAKWIITTFKSGTRAWNGGRPVSSAEVEAIQRGMQSPDLFGGVNSGNPDLQSELQDLSRDADMMAKADQVKVPGSNNPTFHNKIVINDLSDEEEIFRAVDSLLPEDSPDGQKV